MEQELLQIVGVFLGGVAAGVAITLIFNKIRNGAASPAGIRQEFEDYQNEVERHFEETSKKFKDMTEQYQDLYQHLSIGATSLCRPDSVAASLADQSGPETVKLESAAADKPTAEEKSADAAPDSQQQTAESEAADQPVAAEKGQDGEEKRKGGEQKSENSATTAGG